ncbi:MAG: crossover junction endodeoxyribonuclease RuvC [Rickettsiales bacterium]|nr:crossover junction endodeoxyribonuclease RuvC [Rickettsiales bacterium]
MILLGLDPGLRFTGWGLISHEGQKSQFIACGTITTKKDGSGLAKRLVHIYDELQRVLMDFDPIEAAVEETFSNVNAKTTLMLGQARAVSLLVPALKGIEVSEYSANQIKKTVSGSGHAGKEQMMRMVKMLLPKAKFNNDHEADALAVALCHAHNRAHNKMLAG